MAEDWVKRRLAAILAADAAGYSRLMHADEAGTLLRLKALRSQVFEPKVEQYGGRIFKTTGDGVLIEFPSAVGAVQHAIDVQQTIAQTNQLVPDDRRIEFRIGINLGDVIIDGDDIFGDGVNIAARLEGICEPGGIFVTDIVHASVRNKLVVDFVDLGEIPVKNIADPVHVFRVNLASSGGGEKGHGVASNATLRRPAVAVLPFQNMSGDPNQDYFVDGLTEDIITALSMWRSFPVIARVSSFGYKGHSQDVRKVGAELGARYVVEGSVRRMGNRVRVSAQLVNTGSGYQIWSERYDRDVQSIFELQDEIAGNVAAVVAPELVRAESERLSAVRPENMDAWDLCQRGKFLMNDMSKSALLAARQFFERAVELAPNFVDAWCGIAHTHHRELMVGISGDTGDAKTKMLDAARRAVALDDTSAAAHSMLCLAYANNGHLADAVGQGERAVDLNGIDPSSHDRLGAALTLAGRPAEAVHHLTASIRLHPRHPRVQIYYALLARAYLDAHQYEAAADQARRAIQRGRTFFDEHLVLASALGHLGRAEEARAALEAIGIGGLRLSHITLSQWWQNYAHSEPNKHLLYGLRKAGLPA